MSRTGVGEVLLLELSVLDLEAALEDFVGLVAPDCDVHGDLLVPLDVEAPDGVAGPRGDWLLPREILEHLGSYMKEDVPLVSLSPDSPTLMLRTSFSILISRMGFSFSA